MQKYWGRVGKKASTDCRYFELKLSNTTLQVASQTASHSAKTCHAATKIQQKDIKYERYNKFV